MFDVRFCFPGDRCVPNLILGQLDSGRYFFVQSTPFLQMCFVSFYLYFFVCRLDLQCSPANAVFETKRLFGAPIVETEHMLIFSLGRTGLAGQKNPGSLNMKLVKILTAIFFIYNHQKIPWICKHCLVVVPPSPQGGLTD